MTREEIMTTIQECTEKLGHVPSFPELQQMKVSKRAIRANFGTYCEFWHVYRGAQGMRAGETRSRIRGGPEAAIPGLGEAGTPTGEGAHDYRLRAAWRIQPVTHDEVLRKLEAVAGRDVGICKKRRTGKRMGRCTERCGPASGARQAGWPEIKTHDPAHVQAQAAGGPARVWRPVDASGTEPCAYE